jgi:putative transcriptional regulator
MLGRFIEASEGLRRHRFRRRRPIAAALLLALTLPPWNATQARSPAATEPGRELLTGKLLVAGPGLGDPHFRRTVVFMVRHDRDGAMGLVVNRKVRSTSFASLIEGMGGDAEGIEGEVLLHYGGPVKGNRGFVLHSADYSTPHSIHVNEQYGVTASIEVLQAMARGSGPKRALLVMGYAGWRPGQLESELKRGDWVVAPPSGGILFDDQYSTKWERAFASRYITI